MVRGVEETFIRTATLTFFWYLMTSPDDWFKRQAKLYFLKLKQIEPIGYTTPEIRRMIEEGNTFIENVFREGKDIELNKFRVRSVKKREEGRGDDQNFCNLISKSSVVLNLAQSI